MSVSTESLLDILSESMMFLELPGVLEEVASHAESVPGSEAVQASLPGDDMDTISAELNLVAQLKEVVGLQGTLGMADLIPLEGIISRLENPATVLDAEEILAVADLLGLADRLHRRLADLAERYVLLRGRADTITPIPMLEARIRRVFDEHGMVRATASTRLREIHERARSVRQRITQRLEDIVHSQDLSRVVQEDYVTLRNDRYVILLRPEFKGLLDGIVHDHSRSGASVYVEPFSAVELNNQVASLKDEERDEILRLFAELTQDIRTNREGVLQDYDALTWLDAFQARALYAAATASVVPEIVEDGFHILAARHPLLVSGQAEVVPMDVIQESITSATVISGANMGGKTVALKIAGLFPLMARCGIMLPAREGTKIRLFGRIMADIGEEQDIRSRVSSFSGHMMRIKSILDEVNLGDLVLLDELGGATDPEEGSALAMAIMDELIGRGARVVVTTHLTHLKAYAMGRPDVKNVSVEFHPQTLKPTFHLLYDLPGESHAIQTAERIGLAPKVTEAARNYLGRAGGGSSQLVESLRNKLNQVETLRKTLEEEQRTLHLELTEVQSQKEAIVEEFRKTAREGLKAAERRLADLQQSLKEGKVRRGPKVRQVLDEVKAEVVQALGRPLEKIHPSLEPGTRVRVTTLGREGSVKRVLDKGRVEIAMGNLTVRADAEDLVVLGRPRERGKASPPKKEFVGVHLPLATPRWEVNVIGHRVDDALPIVDKAIDEALMSGLASVIIVHGKGTGRLKKAIWDYLSSHAFVTDLQPGDIHGGGEGVTVVHLVSE
jgi:DNA mismatch repair protein MutS2